VIPAKNGSINPFGVLQAVAAVSHPNWKSRQDENYDIGFIFLDSAQTAEQVGWFDCAVIPDHISTPPVVDVVGYPDDWNKPEATMWKNSGAVQVSSPYTLHYQIDTSKGQSGSPVFFTSNNDSMQKRTRVVVAIHTNYENGSNGGVRITADIYARIQNYNQKST
jgi:glutamyl endopeptidase